jgi:hypothetical protein
MLYNTCSRSSALFCLLTSATTLALYIPHSKIITTTTTTSTSKTTFIWSDQNQQFDPFNEGIATLPFICFQCPIHEGSPKLLREIRIFAPAGESGAPLNDPEPRALVCEYDINDILCRYDPVCITLSRSLTFSLMSHPKGHWCASCRPTVW